MFITADRYHLICAVALIGISACYYDGENERLEFTPGDVVDTGHEFNSGDQMLVGSRFCPTFNAWTDEEGNQFTASPWEPWLEWATQLRACYEEAVEGPGALTADGCVQILGAGEITWTMTVAGSCESTRA